MAAKKHKGVHVSHNLVQNGRSDHKCSKCNATGILHASLLKKACTAS